MPIFPTLQGDLSRFSPTAPALDLRQPLQQLMSTFEQGRERKIKRLGSERDRAILNALLSGEPIEPFEPQQPTGILANIMDVLGGGRVTARDLPVSPTETLAAKGAIAQRKAPFTKAKIQTTLGELESGGATTLLGQVIKFEDLADNPRQGATTHVLRKLGRNWKTISPEAVEIIDRKWPDPKGIETERIKAITLPANISTTSQAIKHLMRREGMTRPEAIDWLKARR